MLDSLWRSVANLWNHPELKMDYFFIWIQMFSLWTTAALIWISIHPYAQTLDHAVNHKVALLELMKAESDFYNVVSAAEVKGLLLTITVVAQVIWTQIAY